MLFCYFMLIHFMQINNYRFDEQNRNVSSFSAEKITRGDPEYKLLQYLVPKSIELELITLVVALALEEQEMNQIRRKSLGMPNSIQEMQKEAFPSSIPINGLPKYKSLTISLNVDTDGYLILKHIPHVLYTSGIPFKECTSWEWTEACLICHGGRGREIKTTPKREDKKGRQQTLVLRHGKALSDIFSLSRHINIILNERRRGYKLQENQGGISDSENSYFFVVQKIIEWEFYILRTYFAVVRRK